MRLLGLFIAQASVFLGGGKYPNGVIFGGNVASRQDLSILKASVTNYSGEKSNVPLGNTSDAIKIKYKNPYIEDSVSDYIKKLEADNERLACELCDSKKLLQDLATDFRQLDQTRRSCMIFELYRRFFSSFSNDLEDRGVLQEGKKLEAFLKDIRRGKAFADDRTLHWLVKFETSPEALALKKFRNDHAHHTIDDIAVLRQWRTDLLQDTSPHNQQLNSASIAILNNVIAYLSAPKARPLQKKYHVEPKVTRENDDDITNSSSSINSRIQSRPKEAKVLKKKTERQLKFKHKKSKKSK